MCSKTEVNEENVLRWATISGLNTQYCGADIKKVAQSLVKSGQLITRKRGRYTMFSAPQGAATVPAATAPAMTTEITTIVTYRIQNQDQHSNRWFNDALHTDHAQASQSLAAARKRYPNIAWRLLLKTTTTEVIA